MKRIVMDSGGSAYRELVVWAMAEVTSAQKARLMDHRTVHCYRELIFRLRGTFGALYDYADQPIGFFYVHFVCFLSALYLPLFTIQVALEAGTKLEDLYWVKDVLSGLLVLLQAVYVLGLRYIADSLSDPYGDDLEDLSILEYINGTWLYSRRMLEAELPSEPTIEEEDFLVDQAEQSIGEPWETADDPWDNDDSSVTDSNADIASMFEDEDSSDEDGDGPTWEKSMEDVRAGRWKKPTSMVRIKANLDAELEPTKDLSSSQSFFMNEPPIESCEFTMKDRSNPTTHHDYSSYGNTTTPIRRADAALEGQEGRPSYIDLEMGMDSHRSTDNFFDAHSGYG